MKQDIKKDMVASLILHDKKLLLVHNTKYKSLRIEPPGGKKEENESWEESVIRETKEELGITVHPTKLFGIYDTSSPEGNFSVHMYFCEIIEGEPRITEPDKISNFGWYCADELEDLKRFGYLVPNMCEALVSLKPLLIN